MKLDPKKVGQMSVVQKVHPELCNRDLGRVNANRRHFGKKYYVSTVGNDLADTIKATEKLFAIHCVNILK